jgi:hypothetical protein
MCLARSTYGPKGLQDSAQGFNQVSTLGTIHKKCFALKGRQNRRDKTHVENGLDHVVSRPFRAREMQDEKDQVSSKKR